MELRDYLRVLRKNWLILVAMVIIGLTGGTALALTTTPMYSTSTKLYVSVRTEGAATGELVQGTTFARQMVTSYVDVIGTALVLEPVIDELKLDTTVSELAQRISADAPQNTVNINISVRDADPKVAVKIADTTADSFRNAVQNTLEKPASAEGISPVQVWVTQPAELPEGPSSPNIPLYVLLGAFLGLIAGIAIAALRTVLDTRVHTTHDIEQVTSYPVLGGIANDPEARSRPLIVHADPRSPRAESFRSLRTNLQFLDISDGPRTFVVSSAGPGEGKSTTTANLAIALSETGARVALLDGDLRLPRVADYMGIEGSVGMTDVLIGRVEVADALQKWGDRNLYVLTSGRVPPNPTELLGSAAMDNLITQLGEYFDFVLIDAPPILLVTDAALLSKKTRGMIMVAASGKVRKPQLTAAIRALETAGGKLLGLVATMLPTRGPDAYGYGSYVYGETPNTSKKKNKKPKKRTR